MLNTNGRLLKINLALGWSSGLIHESGRDIDAIISESGEGIYLLTKEDNIAHEKIDRYGNIVILDPFIYPIPVRRVIKENLFVGYDGSSYLVAEVPLLETPKLSYHWLIDIDKDKKGNMMAVADSIIK